MPKKDKEIERTPYARRMKQAREASGLSQPEVCRRLGLSQSTYADLETKAHGSAQTAQLARLYAVDAYWLATGEGKPHAQSQFDDETMDIAIRFQRLERAQRAKWRLLVLVAQDGVNPTNIKPAPESAPQKKRHL